jgi:hypothetical protein
LRSPPIFRQPEFFSVANTYPDRYVTAVPGPAVMPPIRVWAPRHVGLAAFIFLALPASSARAQEPTPAAEPAAILVGVEARRETIRYHFDNPSSFDTSFLVPHFFEQAYASSNVWLVAAARYTAGVRMETSVGATPQRIVRADDYDTFFDPDNRVIVAGSTGDASSRAVLFSQMADVGRAGPVRMSVGYRLRWDRFDFHVGHTTTTRNGVLIAAGDVTSPEMTDSKLHEFLAGFRAARRLAGGWHLNVSGEMSPMTRARLSVQLPEKYPGEDLVFLARVFATSARVAIAHDGKRWPVEIAARVGRTWSYRSTERLSLSTLGIALSAGRAW